MNAHLRACDLLLSISLLLCACGLIGNLLLLQLSDCQLCCLSGHLFSQPCRFQTLLLQPARATRQGSGVRTGLQTATKWSRCATIFLDSATIFFTSTRACATYKFGIYWMCTTSAHVSNRGESRFPLLGGLSP